MAARTAAERQSRYRARRAAQITQMAERLAEIERNVTAWDREIRVAGEERRQGNAYLEMLVKRVAALEREQRGTSGDWAPPRFSRNGLVKERDL